ncbi:Gfo/Idh/MocA family oxidoreductase [Methylophilaceae bacterium]|nr:Gfo/Idh/MocA family oxidoreductase [Methylophilaceae bacterium]
MKIGFLIIGRLKSTRLPKKLLLDIHGKPVITHMIQRLKLSNRIDSVILCTSLRPEDKPLEIIAKDNGIDFFFGDPDDVLLRMLNAAEKFNLDYILTITADCPFVDPFYADKIVDKYLETNADLIRQFDLPHGVFSYGVKVEALRKVVQMKDSSETEVWGHYFTDTGIFNVIDLDVEDRHHYRPGLRMTLDYPEDFQFIKKIYDALYKGNKIFTLSEILTLLDNNPEIIQINNNCDKKFKKRFASQSNPKFKKIIRVKSVLIMGAGSIGQRHIKNLRQLGIENIVALRSKKGHYKKLPQSLGVIEVSNMKEAIAHNPEIAVIANPSSLHLDSVRKVAEYVKGIFIEKPLSISSSKCDEIVEILNQHKVVSFVGHNLMFHPIVKNIMKFYDENDIGEIVNIQCQVGQWLPDWHPYEDYKNAYYARKDLGGGAALTLIHEIHLALELAGKPLSVVGEISEYEKLNLDIDTCSDLMIKHHAGAVSQIHLDYLQQPSHRSGLVTYEKGWVAYDFSKNELVGQISDEKIKVIWSDKKYDGNQPYIDQLKEFIGFVEEGRVRHKYNALASIDSLKVVDAFFESSLSDKKIHLPVNRRFTF